MPLFADESYILVSHFFSTPSRKTRVAGIHLLESAAISQTEGTLHCRCPTGPPDRADCKPGKQSTYWSTQCPVFSARVQLPSQQVVRVLVPAQGQLSHMDQRRSRLPLFRATRSKPERFPELGLFPHQRRADQQPDGRSRRHPGKWISGQVLRQSGGR